MVDSHLDFINAGAEIIITNNFKVRKSTFSENGIVDRFDFANKKAGELAVEAKKIKQRYTNWRLDTYARYHVPTK